MGFPEFVGSLEIMGKCLKWVGDWEVCVYKSRGVAALYTQVPTNRYKGFL